MVALSGAAFMVITLLVAACTPAPALTSPPTPVATASNTQADPSTVVRILFDGINRGDAAGVLRLFSDDVSWERGGQCPPGTCVGQAAMQREIQRDIAAQHRINLVAIQASDGMVTGRFELQNAQTRARGVQRVIQMFSIEVRDGKIHQVRIANDLTDPETANFVSGLPATPTPTK